MEEVQEGLTQLQYILIVATYVIGAALAFGRCHSMAICHVDNTMYDSRREQEEDYNRCVNESALYSLGSWLIFIVCTIKYFRTGKQMGESFLNFDILTWE